MHPIRDPNFLALLVTRTVARVTQGFFSVPLMWWVLEKTGSGSLVATTGLASVLAGVIASPLGGVWADRMSKRRLIFLTYAFNVVVLVSLAMLVSSGRMQVVWVYPLVVMLSFSGSLRNPALAALTPLILPRERYQQGNAAMGLAMSLGGLASFAIAGAMTGFVGVHGAFSVAAVLVTFSALVILLVREPAVATPLRPAAGAPQRRAIGELWEVFQMLGRNPLLLWATVAALLINVILTPLTPIMAPYAKQLGMGPAQFGYLSAAPIAGTVLGLAAMNVVRITRPLPVLVLGTWGIGLGIGGLAGATHLIAALVLLAFAGFMAAIMNVQLQTVSQQNIPLEAIARTTGVSAAISAAVQPIGYTAAAALLAAFAPRTILAGMGAVLLPVGLAWLQPSVRRGLKALHGRPSKVSSTSGSAATSSPAAS